MPGSQTSSLWNCETSVTLRHPVFGVLSRQPGKLLCSLTGSLLALVHLLEAAGEVDSRNLTCHPPASKVISGSHQLQGQIPRSALAPLYTGTLSLLPYT